MISSHLPSPVVEASGAAILKSAAVSVTVPASLTASFLTPASAEPLMTGSARECVSSASAVETASVTDTSSPSLISSAGTAASPSVVSSFLSSSEASSCSMSGFSSGCTTAGDSSSSSCTDEASLSCSSASSLSSLSSSGSAGVSSSAGEGSSCFPAYSEDISSDTGYSVISGSTASTLLFSLDGRTMSVSWIPVSSVLTACTCCTLFSAAITGA